MGIGKVIADKYGFSQRTRTILNILVGLVEIGLFVGIFILMTQHSCVYPSQEVQDYLNCYNPCMNLTNQSFLCSANCINNPDYFLKANNSPANKYEIGKK